MKEILPTKLSQKQAKHFFHLYQNKLPPKTTDASLATISIKALSFNYDKYRKAQTEVANILSQKYLKERYVWVKDYLVEFDVVCVLFRRTTMRLSRP